MELPITCQAVQYFHFEAKNTFSAIPLSLMDDGSCLFEPSMFRISELKSFFPIVAGTCHPSNSDRLHPMQKDLALL